MPLPPSVPNLDVKAGWAESTAGGKLVGLADWSNQSLFIFLRSGAIPGWRRSRSLGPSSNNSGPRHKALSGAYVRGWCRTSDINMSASRTIASRWDVSDAMERLVKICCCSGLVFSPTVPK